MVHSPSRSNNQAFPGVGLLNHPQRVSSFGSDDVFSDRGCALAKVIASNEETANTSAYFESPFAIDLLSKGINFGFQRPYVVEEEFLKSRSFLSVVDGRRIGY